MEESITIPNSPPEEPAMDFEFLRNEGIKYLEELSGKLWTDFNVHDPGIAILEQLCYAITDLGYRINFDIKELLTRGDNNSFEEFFTPSEILTTNPVTLKDYRKIILDVEGVRNAWLSKDEKPLPESYFTEGVQKSVIRYKDPATGQDIEEEYLVEDTHGLFALELSEQLHIKGLYKVLLDVDGNPTEVKNKVEQRINACRNICEDFSEIKVLDAQMIRVKATIEVGDIENLEELSINIYDELLHQISPMFTFYSLKQMLEKGKTIDEIFDGPVLSHGFIDDEELERYEKKTALRISDIINEIMNIEGVVTVSSITLQADEGEIEHWSLDLDNSKIAKLDIDNSEIILSRKEVEFSIDKTFIAENLQIKDLETINVGNLDIVQEATPVRDLARYCSVQHDMPDNFGISKGSLLESENEERKAKAKQLKAYLLFFEQVLANYFAQLANFKDFYSYKETSLKSYHTQPLDDVPAIDSLLFSVSDYQERLEGLIEKKYTALDRKNRALNHLLARFSEDFTDYSLMLYHKLNGQENPGEQLLRIKSRFLTDYPEISSGRARAFNYLLDNEQLSGLEKRLCRILDIDENSDERFFIVEHILLRPVGGDYFQKYGDASDIKAIKDLKLKNEFYEMNQVISNVAKVDPYSLQLSFIFPKWPERYKDERFQQFIQKKVRQETPAHLVAYVKWMSRKTFLQFKTDYFNWIKELKTR